MRTYPAYSTIELRIYSYGTFVNLAYRESNKGMKDGNSHFKKVSTFNN